MCSRKKSHIMKSMDESPHHTHTRTFDKCQISACNVELHLANNFTNKPLMT